MIVPDVIYGLFQRQHTFTSIALIESQVRFVGHAMLRCRINDGLVEFIQRAGSALQQLSAYCYLTVRGKPLDMFRHLVEISVQAHAQHGLLGLDLSV